MAMRAGQPRYSRLFLEEGSAAVDDLAGDPVRLRFVLREADLFSFRFVGK